MTKQMSDTRNIPEHPLRQTILAGLAYPVVTGAVIFIAALLDSTRVRVQRRARKRLP
jgi:hypothetical protein